MLYAYRNRLVHNFRESGYPIELPSDGSEPYYMGYMNAPCQLVFPVGLFKDLCTQCLNGLKRYLEKNDINPYDNYNFGEMWIEEGKLTKKSYRIFFIKWIRRLVT